MRGWRERERGVGGGSGGSWVCGGESVGMVAGGRGCVCVCVNVYVCVCVTVCVCVCVLVCVCVCV